MNLEHHSSCLQLAGALRHEAYTSTLPGQRSREIRVTRCHGCLAWQASDGRGQPGRSARQRHSPDNSPQLTT